MKQQQRQKINAVTGQKVAIEKNPKVETGKNQDTFTLRKLQHTLK